MASPPEEPEGPSGSPGPDGEARLEADERRRALPSEAPPSRPGVAHRTGSYQAVGVGAEPRQRYDPSRTGYFKPLPPTGRFARLVESVGLWVGQRVARAVRDDSVYMILIAALVGVTAGAAAGILLLWIESATELFEAVEEQGRGLALALWLGLPVVGGLLVGLLRLWMKKREREIPSVGSVMHVVAHPQSLDGRGALALGLGTGLTLGSGGSAGHEGPSVAIGAAVGSVVGRFLGLRMRRQMSMVGAGAAAGLAAAFNAPLSGVIFTVEILFRRSVGGSVGSMSVFLPLIVAAVTGTMTSHAIFGDRTEFVLSTQATYTAIETPIYILLAALAALAAIATNRAIVSSRRAFVAAKFPDWLKPALGGLLVGVLAATTYSELLGSGRHLVADAVNGRVEWTDAAALGALKIGATALTLGSLGMGGVFMPSLFVGACLGALVAPLADFLLPSASPAGAYALIGMAAMLGSMLRAPLTPVIMLFELTHDYGIILPGMFVAILGSFIASRIDPRAYHEHMLGEEGKDLADLSPEHEGNVMQRGRVGELMIEPDHLLRLDAPLEEVQRAALVEDQAVLYVVDDEGKVVGLIDTARLAARVLRGELDSEGCARNVIDNRRPDLLVPEDTLAGAMLAMSRSRLAVLPVCDAERHLLGLLQRQDLIAHYAFNVLEQRETQLEVRNPAGDHLEVGLGRGVILERMVVGRTWAGQTLAELDLRKQSGVQVVEWCRQDKLVPLDPHVALREGDVLALMGDRKALLQARWLA